jgi:serine/threonine protein kinase
MIESSFLAPGEIVENRYTILKEIGRGGFGRTYLAEDRNKYGEHCVLKEFAPQVEGDAALQKAQELFQREAQTLYQLKHPQIPCFRELFVTHHAGNNSLFLVQDYVEGQSYWQILQDRLQTGKTFTEAETIALMRDLLPVLDYIHRTGVVHRDITPDNIIRRTSDGLPVLIDFGGVKQIAVRAVQKYSQQNFATRIGKQGYAPDEQMVRGQAFPSSDLYALAATAITLISGKQPIDLYDTHHSQWKWQSAIPVTPEFAKILERLLAYQPPNRYQSAGELLDALSTLPLPNNYNPPIGNNSSPTPPNPVNNPVNPPIPAELTNPHPVNWRKPLQVGGSIVGVGLAATLVISLVIKGVSAIVSGVSGIFGGGNNPPATQTRSPSSTAPSQIPNAEKTRRDRIANRLKEKNLNANEFYRRVDREFYRQHPELQQRSLSNDSRDNKLREEWLSLAEKLLNN